MRSDAERLRDILDAITAIERYAREGREVFARDERTQVWIVHHVEIIGEAARALTQSLRDANPSVPWPQIIGMRNLLAHAYFSIDVAVVWAVVERDLPDLKREVERMLREFGDST